jgi:hypothetical protein
MLSENVDSAHLHRFYEHMLLDTAARIGVLEDKSRREEVVDAATLVALDGRVGLTFVRDGVTDNDTHAEELAQNGGGQGTAHDVSAARCREEGQVQL